MTIRGCDKKPGWNRSGTLGQDLSYPRAISRRRSGDCWSADKIAVITDAGRFRVAITQENMVSRRALLSLRLFG